MVQGLIVALLFCLPMGITTISHPRMHELDVDGCTQGTNTSVVAAVCYPPPTTPRATRHGLPVPPRALFDELVVWP